ncbi:MAG: alpha/beta hydrolase [Acidobacteria bacterium]|nr:alpha/beta hydrolase [Acidobacteriota bacterium]
MRLLLSTLILPAALAQIIPLWPDRPDHSESFIGPNDTERRLRKITNPLLTVHLAPQPNGTAILIAPGGGFRHLAIDKEGHDVARWLNSLGISAFVLQYSAGSDPSRETVITRSLEDIRQAMRLLRQRATELRFDPDRLGVMGFSAGGYLAADLALRSEPDTRPAFAIPVCPAAPPDLTVPPDAPPLLLLAAHDDPLTPNHTLPLYTAWSKANRPATLHIYATGKHGFGIRKTGVAADPWPDHLAAWLRTRKLL